MPDRDDKFADASAKILDLGVLKEKRRSIDGPIDPPIHGVPSRIASFRWKQ